jgi:hypothetical protein
VSVSAIIVTRGDVDLAPVLHSFFNEWEILVWDNGVGHLRVYPPHEGPPLGPRLIDSYRLTAAEDVAVYGRYDAIEYATNDLIYVQDDDCVVSDPQALVDAWLEAAHFNDHVVCNMPPEFRHEFYEEHALVGFGAVFHRGAPARAFASFGAYGSLVTREVFNRTCDIVFTGLTPRVLVDVPFENLPHAYHETRMWKQAGHQAERVRVLDLVREMQ